LNYKFLATHQYWRSFYALPPEQREAVRKKWKVFKTNPFHPSLGTHKIHALSAKAGTVVYSVVVEKNLRVLFLIDGDVVKTIDIGNHTIYQ
jgi:hypothetical protein